MANLLVIDILKCKLREGHNRRPKDMETLHRNRIMFHVKKVLVILGTKITNLLNIQIEMYTILHMIQY